MGIYALFSYRLQHDIILVFKMQYRRRIFVLTAKLIFSGSKEHDLKGI